MEKQQLTIKVSVETYQQLKTDIGKGRVSNFVEKLIVKELSSSEKKIEQEYRNCYANNPHLLKLSKQWEHAEIQSWKKFESEKGKSKSKKV